MAQAGFRIGSMCKDGDMKNAKHLKIPYSVEKDRNIVMCAPPGVTRDRSHILKNIYSLIMNITRSMVLVTQCVYSNKKLLNEKIYQDMRTPLSDGVKQK